VLLFPHTIKFTYLSWAEAGLERLYSLFQELGIEMTITHWEETTAIIIQIQTIVCIFIIEIIERNIMFWVKSY